MDLGFSGFGRTAHRFRCTGCGECCRGDITIWLNLEDLGLMARFLGYKTTAILRENRWVSEGSLKEGGFRPYMKFKEASFRFCPFLENRLDEDDRLFGDCRLHGAYQPLVCRLSPMGRHWSARDGNAWFWMLPIEGCPGERVTDTCSPREWLEPLSDRLQSEVRYFQTMQSLQNRQASLETYRALHWDWAVTHTYDDQLARFESSG